MVMIMVLLGQECKLGQKMTWIWGMCVGLICSGCLLLFDSIKESMTDMAEMYSNLGDFSVALGMDKMNMGTLEGYYAIEISIILSLGAAMFSAMLGVSMVSKEEEGHTSEFLNTLPFGRLRIIVEKYGALLATIIQFHMINVILILAGFAIMKDIPQPGKLAEYHSLTLLMSIEIGTICFLISAVTRKKLTGAAIGIALLFYVMNLMANVVPALDKLKLLTPFYYCNAADIFAGEHPEVFSILLAGVLIAGCLAAATLIYKRRDLA